MEKQLVEVNKAIEYLVKLERSYSDKTFGIRNDKGKIILKGVALQRAKEKQSIARNRALATWANYNGSNKYLRVLHDKDIGKISHGGVGGFSGKGRGNALGSLMDWTINQQKFNTNSDNTRYTSGHVKGMLTSSAALEELRKDQAWILKNLGSAKITKDMYKNMPWAIRHSDIPELEELYGSKYSLGVPNPLQVPHKGRIMGDDGMPNPFASDKFIDYRYDESPRTVTKKRRFLGINVGSTTRTVPGNINYNIKDYNFKTDHFPSTTITADSNDGTGGAVNKTKSTWEGNTLYGGGGLVGRGTDVRMSDGGSTALSIHRGERWGRYKEGDTLGVMTRSERRRYNREVLGIGS